MHNVLAAIAWLSVAASADTYDFKIVQTLKTGAVAEVLSPKPAEIRGQLTVCPEKDRTLFRMVETSPAQPAVTLIQIKDKLFKTSMQDRTPVNHLKLILNATEENRAPKITKTNSKTAWGTPEKASGELEVRLTKASAQESCPPESTATLTPEPWEIEWDVEKAAENYAQTRQFSDAMTVEELLQLPPSDAADAMKQAKIRKRALTAFDSSIKRKQTERAKKLAALLCAEGSSESQEKVLRAAKNNLKTPELSEALVRNFFLVTRGTQKSVDALVAIFKNEKASLGTRDAALLAAAGVASVSGEATAKAFAKTLAAIIKASPGEKDPFWGTYQGADKNLK